MLVFAAGFAWYTASAMLLAETAGRVVLPLGKLSRAANAPGARPTEPVAYSRGMPGAKAGQ